MADISPLFSQGSSAQKMEWSSRSANLAREISQQLESAASPQDRCAILKQGLTGIVNDRDTTANEKALASMALSYSSAVMETDSIAAAQKIVLGSFITALCGSMGSVVGRISLDTVKSIGRQGEKNSLLCYNLRALERDARVTPDEKRLATLGLSYSSSVMNADAVLRGRICIADALAASVTAPAGYVLADVMLRAEASITPVSDKNQNFYYGIKKLHDELPDGAPEKALTSLALTYSSSVMNNDAIMEARKSITEKLAQPLVDTPERTVIAASLDALPRIGKAADRNRLLYYGLKNVNDRLPDTSPEKALTRLALTFSSSVMNPDAILEARKCLAEKLSKPLTESPGRAVITASLDALSRIGRPADRNHLLYHGFKEIQDHSPANSPEKVLTGLGLSYNSSVMNPDAILEARASIAKTLSASCAENPVKLIMGATSDAVNSIGNIRDKNYCLFYAFKAVEDLPGASAEQKKIAARALAGSTSMFTTEEVLKKRLELVQEILQAKNPLDELKEMAANLTKPKEAENIITDEGETFISIDGVKLEIKDQKREPAGSGE